MSVIAASSEALDREARTGSEEPLFIRSGDYQIFAVYHTPTSAGVQADVPRSAFVFCPPLFEEEKSSHRTFVELARRLCEAGYPILRIQYRGCGDSEGEFEEFTCADWREDLRVALDFLRNRGETLLGLLGLRLGAAFAAEVAETEPDVKLLVLWEPIINGRQHMSLNLRRKLLRKMLTEREGGVAGASDQTPGVQNDDDSDSTDFEGYLITRRLQEGVAGVDLLEEIESFSASVLLTQISSQSAVTKAMRVLQQRYQDIGAHVQVHTIIEQPIWNLMDLSSPDALLQKTADWIVEP